MDVIDFGHEGWEDEDDEWGCVGKTIKEVKEAFQEAVDDNLDH